MQRAAGRLRRAATPTLYEVLGLPPDAEAAQIKTAYRALARRLHPDVNAGDATTTARLVEVNRAYATLADPEARAVYDKDLAGRRAEARRGFALLTASTVVTFAVTVIAVSSTVRWHLQTAHPLRAELPALLRPREPPARSPMPVPATVQAALQGASHLGLSAPIPGGANWTTYRDTRFDFALRYPAGIFRFDPTQSGANVHTFVSRDGRAVLRIVAAEIAARTTLVRFGRALIKKRYRGAAAKLRKILRRRRWFALWGTHGEEILRERVTFACDGRSMHGWLMRYPESQRATYDRLAGLILRNHPHGNGPGAGCTEARPKAKAKRRYRRRARRRR